MLLAVCGGKQPGNVEHLENRTVATIAQVPSKASLFTVKGSDVEGNVILQRGSMAIENRVGEHVKFGAMPAARTIMIILDQHLK